MRTIIIKAIGLIFRNIWKQFKNYQIVKILQINSLKSYNGKIMYKSQSRVKYSLLILNFMNDTS